MSIGVAILGGGIFAREEHLPAVQASQHLTLKAVWSRSLKSAKTLEADESQVDLYSEDSGTGKSLDDLLRRSDISAVIIALPIPNQPDYIRKVLLAGKHVLSEKPIAASVPIAVELLEWYHREIDTSKVTWGVAENFRYLHDITTAAEELSKAGRILTFRIRSETLVSGGKYYETPWRKVPTYQGGFLLDGGIHTIAGLRLLFAAAKDPIVSVSAFTAQLQEHLPPVDTISATFKTKSGAIGSLSLSFGTTFKGSEYLVATEQGIYGCTAYGDVTIKGETKKVQNERSGVPTEIRAWGEALASGKPNAKQSPQEGLADVEILESCLRSGEQGGTPIELQYQNV